MAILKKTLFKQNLDRVNTLIYDNDPLSKYFKITELSDTFTGGKNSFLIQGSEFLVNDTEIKIEIKDANGDTIYYEPADGDPEPYEGVSKVVAVHIYPDTAFGPCTITILGEVSDYVDSNGQIIPVPDNWKSSYNVKWQKSVNVNPNLRNTTKIRFYKRPKFEITEEILPIYNRLPEVVTISGSIDGVAINPQSETDFRLFNGFLNYQLQIKDNTAFSQSMEGKQIIINGLSQSYSPTIRDVVTSKTALVNIPYLETSSINPNVQIVKNFESASYTASFENIVLVTGSNIDSSFAKIKISNLDTFTGDVYRVKVYGKSQNNLGDFQLLEDIQLESSDLLIASEFSSSLNVRKGIFTQKILDSFWVTQSIDTQPIVSIDDDLLFKSVKLVPTVYSNSSNGLFYLSTSESIDFSEGTEYQLDFTPLLSSSAENYGRVDVYLSGSSFVDTDINFGYGKLLTSITTNTNFRRFDKQQINFKADSTGTGKLLFLVKCGAWQFTDVSLSTASETSFSPNEITLTVNVPNKINNETFDFKFEFYDINNNYVPADFRQSFNFVGGNDLVAGKDIILTLSNTSFAFSNNDSSSFPDYINFNVQTVAITGSITFYSSAFDSTGSLIPNTESPYPGLLQKLDNNNWRLTTSSFSGSLVNYGVSAILYTASADGIERYATVYRLNEGKTGKTGAGIVYRGEWSASVDYYGNDKRRDVVLGKRYDTSSLTLEDEYFICAIDHTSVMGQRPADENTGGVTAGNVWSNLWTTFSVQFDSVATDILFAQDVYANRTINIGSKGGSPVIALDSDHPTHANPNIRISASFYNDNGIFLGYDGGVPKFSIRGGNNGVNWDGANLIISGNIDAREGRIGGWIIDGNSLRNSNSRIRLDPVPPAIEIYDENYVKRLDIRYGNLTDYNGNPNAEVTIDPTNINIVNNTYVGPIIIDEPIVYSNFTNLTVSQAGTYFGNLVWNSIGTIGQTNDTFSGYVSFERGIEIRDNSDNVIYVINGNGGSVFSPNSDLSIGAFTNNNVSITFPAVGTYKVYTFYKITGGIYSTDYTNFQLPIFELYSINWDNVDFTFRTNIDLTELTNEGIQVVNSNDKYFRIKRNDSEGSNTKVIARVGGTMIYDAGVATNDAIIIEKGNLVIKDGSITNGITNNFNFSSITASSGIYIGGNTLYPPDNKPSSVTIDQRFLGITRPVIFYNNAPTWNENGLGNGSKRALQIYSAGPNIGMIVREKVASSKRYKKNFELWEKDVLHTLDKINVYKYHYNEESNKAKKSIGFIAEDLHDNGLTEFVEYNYEDKNVVEAIEQKDIVFLLWKALQELNSKVQKLESQISGSI